MKNDNAHALRLGEALRLTAGEDAAQHFAAQYPLSKSADIRKKFAWAQAVSQALQARYPDDQVRAIRSRCRCNDGASIADKLRRYLHRAGSLQAFVTLFNREESFAQFAYESENALLFCYPECYCACVKRVEGQLPRAWCYCTLGNAEAIFTRLLERPVQAELLESIKTGGSRCVIRITW